MLGRILFFIIGVTAGILVVIYHRWFVKTVGTSGWAEKYLGAGGTYLMWQLIGVLIIVFTVLYSTNKLTIIADAIFGAIGFGR